MPPRAPPWVGRLMESSIDEDETKFTRFVPRRSPRLWAVIFSSDVVQDLFPLPSPPRGVWGKSWTRARTKLCRARSSSSLFLLSIIISRFSRLRELSNFESSKLRRVAALAVPNPRRRNAWRHRFRLPPVIFLFARRLAPEVVSNPPM